jgi:diguanylate cyclase (GGDEF)-like protein/PAS domain S-box-containing protein
LSTPQRAGARILLIDDTAFARDVLESQLEEAKSLHTLAWAGDYEAGLAALTGGGYDVCLLDYQLGDRSGLDLLRAARVAGCFTPVVLLTGHKSEALDHEAMRAGANDYLVKGDFSAGTIDRIVRYLAERARTEAALRESEQRYALALEGSNDGLWDWKFEGDTLHVSARFKRILGLDPDAPVSNAAEDWIGRSHPDDLPRFRDAMQAHLERNETPHLSIELRARHADGTWRHVHVRGKAVRDATGKAVRMAGSLTDVTLARGRDPLTGLASRVLYLDRLEHAFQRAVRDPKATFALLFLDLDRFKNVNDSLGHDAGDELLVAIARRLEGCVRVVDTVARLGGDEFVVLLDDAREPDGPTRVAQRIIDEFSRPFVIRGREVFTGTSIGIANSSAHYKTPGELLRDADNAMYRAKAAGRGSFVVFDPAMHQRAVHVLSVESGLRRALDENHLEVHYQPVVELGSGKPLGFEALVRWRSPERGLVSPAEFIPVAEDSSLIVLLDLHVLRVAAAQLATWRARFGDLSVSVNASRRHFSRPSYVGDVHQALDAAGLPPSALRLEVTESIALDSPGVLHAQLGRLHELGVRLYVDDFGIGYSSLSMLHTLPFAGIKLDRSFISTLDAPAPSTELVRAMLAMAQALRLDVVAEGIETDGQHQRLLELGCARGQGYRFARPMTAEAATAWLEAR